MIETERLWMKDIDPRDMHYFNVYLKGTDKPVGFLYPWGYPPLSNEYWDSRQIGYGFHGNEGKGYCTEALLGALPHIPKEYWRLIISHTPHYENWKSNNVAAKCGFILVRRDKHRAIWEHKDIL